MIRHYTIPGLAALIVLAGSSSLADERPTSVNTQYEDLGERRFRLSLVAQGGDNEGAMTSWRQNAQRLCGNPDWLGEPSQPVSYLSENGAVERTVTGTVFCLTGFADSRSQGSDQQFQQLLDMPLSDYNLPLQAPLYDQLKRGDFSQFLSNFDTVIEEYRNGSLTENQIDTLYDQSLLNDPEQIERLNDLIVEHPQSSVAHLLLANASRDLAWDYRGTDFRMNVAQENYDQFKSLLATAKKHIDLARELDPLLPLVWAHSINIYKGIGTTEGALGVALFRESLAYQPESLETHAAFFHYSLPKWHGSRDILKWLVEDTKSRYHLNPDLIALEALLIDYDAWVLERRGLYEEAREKYREAYNLYPHAWILTSLTNSAFHFGEYDLARQYLETSLRENPGNPENYDALRSIAVEQRDYLEASRLAYAAAFYDKQAIDPLYLRVRIFMAYRRYHDAMTELQKLLDRDKENILAIQQLIAQVDYQLSIRDGSL